MLGHGFDTSFRQWGEAVGFGIPRWGRLLTRFVLTWVSH